MPPKRVLFLCTGNSCRSQMAEAIVNHFAGDRWTAFSAGSAPTGFVHPLALQALAEIGIQHHGESKSVEIFRGQSFDQVITVCGDAEPNCPVWLGKGQRMHIGFPDPARVEGSPAEVLAVFRQVRDVMRLRLLEYLKTTI
nr:arsenate reductase ArsC [Longilinea arvoryzae]